LFRGEFERASTGVPELDPFRQRLLREDIEGIWAHAAMLQACGILSRKRAAKSRQAARGVRDLESGKSEFSLSAMKMFT